jgi:L-fuconolactonase
MNSGIIDTHIHNWDFERAEYSWLKNDTTILNRTYLIDELNPQIESSGVTRGVMVQAANNPEDTALMLEVAGKNNWIAGVVVWLPLMDPSLTLNQVTGEYKRNRYVKGVRHLIHNESDPRWLLQPAVMESLRILAAHRLTYDVVGVSTEHLRTAIEVAGKIPELKLVLDHLNQPPVSTREKFGEWGRLMQEAAEYSNLYCKISGLGTTTGNPEGWTKEDIRPYVLYALGLFGTDHCFCGGDWPVSLLAGSYAKTWGIYRQIASEELNEADQAKILYTNARDFYDLDITDE